MCTLKNEQDNTVRFVAFSDSTSFFLHCSCQRNATRETREVWPLLTVETEANGDKKSKNEKGPWLVCWDRTIDFGPALAALAGPVQYIVFLTVHYFNSFVLIAQQAGQAGMLGHLSLSMCL